jgi:hypothetical protein
LSAKLIKTPHSLEYIFSPWSKESFEHLRGRPLEVNGTGIIFARKQKKYRTTSLPRQQITERPRIVLEIKWPTIEKNPRHVHFV